MTTSLRDVSSAEMVRTLAEMNCFEQECVVYGYSWKKPDGQKMYSMSDDELLIHKAFEEHMLERCCMTPIRQWSTRAILKEETQEDLILYFKLQLAKELKAQYNDTYFDALQVLQDVYADTQAEELLLEWKEELDGYFDADELMLFEGAVEYAYVTKHLPPKSYRRLCQWIQHIRKQMMRKMQMHDIFERTFYGVAYWDKDSEQFSFITNANEKSMHDRVKELDHRGQQHTAVYQKTYWFSRSNDLSKVRKQFEADLKNLMDETYLKRMRTLQNLPSAIPADLWEDCMRKVQEHCTEEAVQGMQFWGHKWNIV